MTIDQRDRVLELLDSGSTYLVVTHENPDGDAIGSALAMTLALRGRGKQVTTCDVHGCPQYLRWLAGATEIVSEATLADYDVVVVIDCGEAARMGKLVEQLSGHPCVINIDHHGTNDGFGHANIVLPKASSSCEILFALFGRWGVTITPDIATNLYVGLYTDTNMFKNMNSTPEAYRACGDLVAAGADFHTAAKRIYIDTSAARLRLLARVLSTLRLDGDGRVAGMICTGEDLNELGLTPDALETFVEYPRAIVGVEAAYLLRELKEKGQVKGSLRSANNADVAVVAQQFTGGGHTRAAGFRATGTLAEVRERLVAALLAALEG
ncbi:MAG TPA: bifunctional oligoribonuclease/PAP phosphatase NrnA [bacterium]|nr:bifunctional oligoribonuclease/PAP phosphatase NrnA [bacterium]